MHSFAASLTRALRWPWLVVDSPEVEARFWRVFVRVMGIETGSGNVRAQELEEWDSLRHVELVFELEETFGLNVSPDDIVALYSDTDTVLAYVREHAP